MYSQTGKVSALVDTILRYEGMSLFTIALALMIHQAMDLSQFI